MRTTYCLRHPSTGLVERYDSMTERELRKFGMARWGVPVEEWLESCEPDIHENNEVLISHGDRWGNGAFAR